MKWHGDDWKTASTDRLKRLGLFLLASLSPVLDGPTKAKANANNIAYLDGLRGFAALLVYTTHHTAFSHEDDKTLNHAFGFRDEYALASLPVLRLFFVGGAFAVALFFAISGYVLSVSPLALIHSQREGSGLRLAKQLGCAFPRRWVRLYLPVIITTFTFMTSWHLFNIESSNHENTGPTATWIEEFGKWFMEFIEGSYVFVTTAGFDRSEYNPHMWSIAVEYRGSAIVYIVALAYFALGYGPTARFWSCCALFAYFQFIADGPYYASFILGMLASDIDMVSELDHHQLPRMLKFRLFEKHRWLWYVVLLNGLYLGSAPVILEAVTLRAETGWAALSYLIPPTTTNARWYFCVYGAILCIISISRIPWLRRTFESAPLQYLGKVSFGFYLVHGPVMWIAGDRLYAAVGRPRRTAEQRIPEWIDVLQLPDVGPLGCELNALVPHLILLPLTLWLAGVVTKLVDAPSVRLSKYLFQQKEHDRSMTEDRREGTEMMLPLNNAQLST